MLSKAHLLEDKSCTVVATDGSHNGDAFGYAYVVDENTYKFGVCNANEDCELTAVQKVYAATPESVALTILTDSQEIILRLRDGVKPKPKNAHYKQYMQAMEQTSTRKVNFIYVQQKVSVVPLHAVAHYLSFLGRSGNSSDAYQKAPSFTQIMEASNSNEYAHELVYQHLFPGI